MLASYICPDPAEVDKQRRFILERCLRITNVIDTMFFCMKITKSAILSLVINLT